MKKVAKFITIVILFFLSPIYFVKHFIESRRYDRKLRERYIQGKRTFDSPVTESHIDSALRMKSAMDKSTEAFNYYYNFCKTTFENGKTNN